MSKIKLIKINLVINDFDVRKKKIERYKKYIFNNKLINKRYTEKQKSKNNFNDFKF